MTSISTAKTKYVRVIPRLDIKGPNVVKGVNLEGLRVLGRPETLAPKYYEEGADEIIYIDTVASLYGRNNLKEIVKRAAENIFIPLTVGGGIRTLDDIQALLRAGADKIAINTAAIKNPRFISEGARSFGSQCIVVSIQAKHRGAGKYECLVDNARQVTGIDVVEWVKKVEDLGAGEIILTSVDKDGTGKGYDVELVSMIAEMANIPIVASGGAGNAAHVKEAILHGKADAVCAASIFHYSFLDLAEKGKYEEEGNIDFLRRKSGYARKNIEPTRIPDLKKYLRESGIDCRI